MVHVGLNLICSLGRSGIKQFPKLSRTADPCEGTPRRYDRLVFSDAGVPIGFAGQGDRIRRKGNVSLVAARKYQGKEIDRVYEPINLA